ncbi:MAG: class I SAM-dependent methyltransferase [Dongiaceae bacterium]
MAWQDILLKNIRDSVIQGRLTLVLPNGRQFTIEGQAPGEHVTLYIHRWGSLAKILLYPSLAVGEAYMEGALTVKGGDIYPLMALYFSSSFAQKHKEPGFPKRLWRRLAQLNGLQRSKQNVKHHYDIGNDFYQLFLDQDMQYSCAYFEDEEDSLEVAQINKKNHIAAKLLLKEGQRILDIGSGWGGLGLHLARLAEIEVKGITLSLEQLAVAQARAAEQGLQHRVEFALADYREEIGQFDRIVSVGMFEHVGITQYPVFFEKVKSLLKEDGVALLHTIGRIDTPGVTNPWLTKYIFPGGYAPSLSEILAEIEKQKLFVTDIEIWRLHYAKTLRHWRQRFHANWRRAKEMFDERFCRMWDFYLAGCIAAFEHDSSVVFQIQIAKSRHAVPLTRDYIDTAKRISLPPFQERTKKWALAGRR